MQITQVALRAFQFFWVLLTTALIGNVIHEAFGGNPSPINYAIFVSVFCWLVVIFGFAAAFVESLAIPIALLVADGLATMFTFIAAVVLSAKLGVHSCGNAEYIQSNDLTNGGADMTKRCHELQASTAFYWFLFAGFVASLVMTGISGGSSLSMRGGRGGVRKGGPSMSQV